MVRCCHRLLTIVATAGACVVNGALSFVLPSSCSSFLHQQRHRLGPLQEQTERDEADVITSLPPPVVASFEEEESGNADLLISETALSTSTTVLVFIPQDTKRILIEKLGYRRQEVERLRPKLAPGIVSKKMKRPTDGVPKEWLMEESTSNQMLKRLETESRYPLKFPLLGISLILLGKGLGDAAITIIKVNMNFPGASLSEQFLGAPVLGIDALCVVAAIALGSFTMETMKDD